MNKPVITLRVMVVLSLLLQLPACNNEHSQQKDQAAPASAVTGPHSDGDAQHQFSDETSSQATVPSTHEPHLNELQMRQQQFWMRLSEHCGEAFEGRLHSSAPGFDLLDGHERVIVHFRSCSDFELRLPFHIETEPGVWDRSRTWVFFNHGADGLELRHDHRHEDGTEEESTWYGGEAVEGEASWQRFAYPPRIEELGVFAGWRVEIDPGSRYVYGTMRDDEWTFRVDFDLTRSVDPPPPPWGF